MDITPDSPSPSKRPRAARPKKAAEINSGAAVPASASESTKPKSRRKTPVVATPAVAGASPQSDLNEMIATAAYYLAAQRSFAPGHEMEDWLTAEQQVLGQHS